MNDLERLRALLEAESVAHALIGASAFGLHGLVRATLDVDLLVVDRRCLDEAFWAPLRDEGWQVTVRKGDFDDGLRGSVRLLGKESERLLDVVVGKKQWDARAIERAEPKEFSGVVLPVALPRDLVLLKLAAGGAKDAWDLVSFFELTPDPDRLRGEVEEELAQLPPYARRLWTRMRSAS